MRILVIQNDPHTPAGMVGERIAARGADMATVLPHDGGTLPATAKDYDAALVLGGPMAADDDARYPAFAPMVDLLREFHGADKPLLGICLGSQLLARCFGGKVRRFEGGLEFGYVPISLTEAGAADPLLSGNGRTLRIMQWHEDTFDLPPDSVQLIAGEACRAQAFRLGRAAYAFQGHFEAHEALVERWLTAHGHILPRHYGDASEAHKTRVRQESSAHGAAQRRFAETVSDRWLDLVQARR
jgi:GMP synthase-like glutamine amidotransferase